MFILAFGGLKGCRLGLFVEHDGADVGDAGRRWSQAFVVYCGGRRRRLAVAYLVDLSSC